VKRWLRHLLTSRRALRRAFPPASLAAIEAAIRAAERTHSGELRFAVESCLDLRRLVAGTTARERALAAFARLGTWDTAQRNGVLIYVLLADRDIEIVADRGFAGRVAPEEWAAVCGAMEAEFRAGQFEAGALVGIRRAAALVARHYPPAAGDVNELPDAPVLLG
jgi:uncharacterized membrane protein